MRSATPTGRSRSAREARGGDDDPGVAVATGPGRRLERPGPPTMGSHGYCPKSGGRFSRYAFFPSCPLLRHVEQKRGVTRQLL